MALGLLRGVFVVGLFQALLTVVGPTNPLMAAANSLVTTRAAHERDRELAVATRYGLTVGIPLLAYCFVLLAAPGAVLQLFFGADSAYRALAPELRMFVLYSLTQYVYFVAAGMLNAREDTAALLRAQVGSAVVVLLAAPMTAVWALAGTVAAAVMSAATRATLATARLRNRTS